MVRSVNISSLTLWPLLPPEMVRTATPFPMVSLLFVFTAFVISNIGHIRPQRTILAFVSGIFFILSGGTRYSCPAATAPSLCDWLQQPGVSRVTHADTPSRLYFWFVIQVWKLSIENVTGFVCNIPTGVFHLTLPCVNLIIRSSSSSII